MDEFLRQLQQIDLERLRVYLCSLERPCYESQLLKVIFPFLEISQAHPLALYQYHFLLFHVLYQLQEEFYQKDAYLFIHFMRTMLLPYPSAGECRYFNEDLACFCRAACLPNDTYCRFHRRYMSDLALEHLSLKYFYADARNFYQLDEQSAVAFLEGTWEILAHYETYQQAFQALDLAETSDIQRIKKQFKRLAKEHHPDRGVSSHERFSEINNAYQFLLRVIPGMKFPK